MDGVGPRRIFDHVSNAQSLSHCQTNQGLNLGGLRNGYAF
jgi:hypothetical protein